MTADIQARLKAELYFGSCLALKCKVLANERARRRFVARRQLFEAG